MVGALQASLAFAQTWSTLPEGASAFLAPLDTPEPSLDVWMLDTGQGSCVYVDCPDRDAAVVVDCGFKGRSGAHTDRPAITGWLQDHVSVDDTVSVIVSHADEDHYAVLPQLDPARIDRIRLGGLRSDYSGSAAISRSIDAWLDDVAVAGGDVAVYPPDSFIADDRSHGCRGARIDILTASRAQAEPRVATTSRKNADSAVVRVTFGAASVVMAGDAEGSTQDAALRNIDAHGLDIDHPTVLMGSHHGASTARSNSAAWLARWRPVAAAFSATVNVSYRHPQCEIIARVDVHVRRAADRFPVSCGVSSGPDIRRTDGVVLNTHDNGTVLFRLTGSSLTILCRVATPACDGVLDPRDAP